MDFFFFLQNLNLYPEKKEILYLLQKIEKEKEKIEERNNRPTLVETRNPKSLVAQEEKLRIETLKV